MRTVPTAPPPPPQGAGACHGGSPTNGRALADGRPRVALVGAPNVGKSALFNRLTGRYVTVSNYPGTSVEVTRAAAAIEGRAVEVWDTPGTYALQGQADEHRVVREVVQDGGADLVVHVIDAKNLARLLPFTLELLQSRRRVIVVLNMMDEAAALGMDIDTALLSTRLGIEVLPVVAVLGTGVAALTRAIDRRLGAAPASERLERSAEMMPRRRSDGPPDLGASETQGARDPEAHVLRQAVARRRAAELILEGAVRGNGARPNVREGRLGRLLAEPKVGLPVLLLVVYLGLYKFVGDFGGGTLVNWLEQAVFGRYLNPWFERLLSGIPWETVRSLFVGDYGVLTLGIRYAVAIILPIVGTFFLFFSVLEDSGYFPRLALLLDRVFKRLGLNGRAVIPMVLGFACDTMATMVTRTLETKRERVLATLLLALAVPCSAQLGVLLAVLAGQPVAFSVWALAVAGSFVLVGAIAARVLPGTPARFAMELPPMRWPRAGNVLIKTYTRVHWYFVEVLPLFLLASVLLWAGELTGVFHLVTAMLRPVVHTLGLPAETAQIFLFGFFRRDYGAAGLYDLSHRGVLSAAQLAVAGVTLTLFVPCIAQFIMMLRERGARTALGMLAFITPFAFGVGFLVRQVLALAGVR